MSKIDLHMHSRISSDGEFYPIEMAQRAKKQNMEIIAVSDHDAVSAIEDTVQYCKELGITCIPATEISSEMKDGTVLHLLGYNIDYHHPKFIEREKKVSEIIMNCSDYLMSNAEKVGFQFNREDVIKKSRNGYIIDEMVGEAILEDHRNDNDERLIDFRPGHKYYENAGFHFYRVFYAQGGICYMDLPNLHMPIEEAANLIHEAGGFMVLAHPEHNLKRNLNKLDEIMGYGLAGVEAYSSYHSKEDVEYWHKAALERNLIVTCGSDFHGYAKPAIEMGSVPCDEQEVKAGLLKYISLS